MVKFPRFKSSKRGQASEKPDASQRSSDDAFVDELELSPAVIKRATRTRKIWSIISSVCLFITVIFLIMVEIGNTYNLPALRDIYFIRLNLANVVPTSFPQATLLNSIARTLGLHDFYQIGLWNYCEGYGSTVTSCTKPMTLYYFNPVQIILSELLAGASIRLPDDITSILNIVEIASHWMFGLFLTGACLSFVLMFLMPLSLKSRWIAFAMMVLTLVNGIFVIAASVIGTVMFIIVRNVFSTNTEVNIGASIGTTMFALMWVASAFALFAFLIQTSLSCCCASRRDLRRGKKRGSKKAYQ